MGHINFVAVLLAAVAAYAVGALWYGVLFGKAWRAALGIVPGQSPKVGPKVGMPAMLGGHFVLILLSALLLGHNFARLPGIPGHLYFMMSGGIAAFFVVPALWINYLYQGQSRKLALIDAGHWITAYLAMGTVFWALR